MKHTLFILALLTASIQTFAQSPRIKLNQITKDSVTGSVLISSPTDSGMVYSRDLFISYGADTVLILGGDTLAATSGTISSVLSDGVTITGDGTLGSELTADTSVLATLRALSDSLALVISSVTADNVTITGDGTVGSPLTVDTATVVASVGRLLDSLINVRTDLDLKQDQLNGTGFVKATGTTISYDNSTYLTGNQTITLSGDVTGSGTTAITATVVDDSHNHIISNVDNLQDSLNSRMVNDFSNASGTLPVANGGTGATSFIANQMLKGNGTSAIQSASNLRENGDTVVVEKILNVDSSFIVRNNELEVHTRGSSYSRPAVAIGFTNSTPVGFKLEIIDNVTGVSTLVLNNTNSGGGLALVKGATGIMFNGSADTWTGGGSTNDAALGAFQSNLKFYTYNSTTLKAQLDASGNWTYLGTSSQISDIKTKKNISLYEDGLSKILNLRPISFTSIFDESNQVRLGFIAQEVQEIIPELVKDNAHSGYMSLNIQGIIPVLTKAIQEQQAIIESQATEIEQLKSQIQLILSEIEQLKNN